MHINIVTFGCSKNLVDSEKLLFQLERNGFEVSHNSEEFTDIVMINTCGFILDAKQESIESILSFLDAKQKGFISKVIVIGCLSERYRGDLLKEMPEIDGIYGTYDIEKIITDLRKTYFKKELYKRSLQTPGHYAYLKISDGCNRNCAFCAIPGIKGKQKSLPIEEIVMEAKELGEKGVKEIILIAQELTSYGTDIYKRKALPELLEELANIDSIKWIRLHYNYPSGFPADEIIRLMKKHRKICRYIDLPIQHVSDRILKLMNRSHDSGEVYHIINKFRSELPEISFRTTLITGFPGESEEDFRMLKEFVREIRFERLGVFSYSHEEGTPAYESFKDEISQKKKVSRLEELLNLQSSISLELNLDKINKIYNVLIDRMEGEFFIGRTEFDSPEVDNEVLIDSHQELSIGDFYDVKITDATEFDLYGEVV